MSTSTTTGAPPHALLAGALAGRAFALVLVSPLRRSQETACLAGFDDRGEVTTDLCEWDYGDYEGRTTAEIRTEVPAWTVWSHPVPGGETADEVGTRIDRVIERARAAGGDVAIFGHGHSLRVFGARWCRMPPTDGRILALDPVGVGPRLRARRPSFASGTGCRRFADRTGMFSHVLRDEPARRGHRPSAPPKVGRHVADESRPSHVHANRA